MIDSSTGTYIVPAGDGKGPALVIDIVSVVKSEIRLMDVAHVNKGTAAELLATFNDSWLQLNKTVTLLTYEKNKAESRLSTARADALLLCTEKYLATLGYKKSSKDIRDALIEKDPEVIRATESLNEIRAVLDYLKGKMQAFENAYNSVKKLISMNTPQPRPLHGNDNLQNQDDFVMPAGFEEPQLRRKY